MRWRWRLSRRLGSLRLRSTSKASSGPEVSSSQSSSHWSSTEAPSSPAPYSSSTRVLSSSFASHQLSTGVPSSFSIHSSSTKIPPSPPEHDHSVSSSDMQNLSPSSSYTLIRHQPSLVNSSDNNTTNNSGDTDDTENSSASTGSSTGNHTRDARDSIVSATRSSSDLDCSAYEAYVLASPGGWSPSVPRRPITPPQQVDHSNRKNFRQDVRVFRFPKEEGDMYQMPGEVSAFEEILLTRGFTTHREYFVDEEMRRVLRERGFTAPLAMYSNYEGKSASWYIKNDKVPMWFFAFMSERGTFHEYSQYAEKEDDKIWTWGSGVDLAGWMAGSMAPRLGISQW